MDGTSSTREMPLPRPAILVLACSVAACGRPNDRAAGDVPADHDAGLEADTAHAAEHGDAMALRPIMQRLGTSMMGLQQALWLEDYDAMSRYAGEISGHVHISDVELARIEAELGEEMPAFDRADSTVHEAAVRLHAAVEARQMDTILDELNQVQTGCASCHTAFRQRLRTDLQP